MKRQLGNAVTTRKTEIRIAPRAVQQGHAGLFHRHLARFGLASIRKPFLLKNTSKVSPRFIGCRGWSRYVEGVRGFLVSWILGFAI